MIHSFLRMVGGERKPGGRALCLAPSHTKSLLRWAQPRLPQRGFRGATMQLTFGSAATAEDGSLQEAK